MLTNIAIKLNTSSKIKILLIVSLILIISHSIFLTLAMTSFAIMTLFLYNIDVRYYINTLKSIIIWIILVQIVYILISNSIIDSFIFVYKFLLIILLINNFIITNNFYKIHSGFYKCLSIFNFSKVNIEKLTYNISIFLIYIQYLFESKVTIMKNQSIKNKISVNPKYYSVPAVVLSVNNIQEFQRTLILEHYKLKKEKTNYISKMLELAFIALLIIVIIREVIL